MRYCWRTKYGIVAVVGALLAAPRAAAAQRSLLEPVDTLIDVGGYRLHFRFIRAAKPVILLESGGGLDANQWNAIAPHLVQAVGSTVVSYDRAGFGQSDLPTTPYDIRTEVDGLWRGLAALGLADSVVMVGHSYGGFLLTLSAHEHSKQVKGLVFVDPNVASFVDAIGGPEALARKSPADTIPPERQTKPQRANVRVLSRFAATMDVLRKTKIPKQIPVRVISAGKQWWPTPKENEEFRKAHEDLAQSVRDGRLLIAEKSAHMVTVQEPEIIEGAVVELIRQLRTPPE
jgi:pimeloyl-ACP methyl ester carboxylesterase